MAYSVLILDDDADFNNLLTDIFEQADYIVSSLEDPIEALEVFKETRYDLVVTDQKMPDMTGAEFMKRVKAIRPDIPVIMVSGYLENDTIRELISDGVGGVFLKPLNIFSLLERTAELIEESQKTLQSHRAEDVDAETGEGCAAALEFPFRSFPCKSEQSLAFAKKLFNLRNFKSTLSLIGPPGSRYRAICEDIRNFYEGQGERFIYFEPRTFEGENALSAIEEAKASGAERVTCVLLDLERMSDTQKHLAVALPKGDGPFEAVDTDLRVIFCVSADLDELFDEEAIDESLYILMGTAEVRVPSLHECSADVPELAREALQRILGEKAEAEVPRMDKSAKDFLRAYKWEENYAELHRLMETVAGMAPGDILSLNTLERALQGSKPVSERAKLESRLEDLACDHLRAVSILSGLDARSVKSFFGVSAAAVKARLN